MNYFFIIFSIVIASVTFAQTDSIVKAKILDDQQEPDRFYNQSIDKYGKNDYEGALNDLDIYLTGDQGDTTILKLNRSNIQGDPIEMTRFCLTTHPIWGRVMGRHLTSFGTDL